MSNRKTIATISRALLVCAFSVLLVQLPAWQQQEAPSTVLARAMADAVVPACTDHDPTRWHPLAKTDAAGNVICSYGHEHGDNPHEVDGVFGPLSAAIPGGQEISYPWHTPNENETKHEFYKWATQTNLASCKQADSTVSFDAFRVEMHHDGHAGAAVRFHSFFFQAHACDPRDPNWTDGFVSIGGRADTGLLNVDEQSVFEANDTDPGYEQAGAGKRVHDSQLTPPGLTHSTWYSNIGNSSSIDNPNPGPLGILRGTLAGDRAVFGPVNPKNVGVYPPDPGHPLEFYSQGDVDDMLASGRHLSSSGFGVHILALILDGNFPPADGNGFISWEGFVDHNGNFLASCAPLGPDCVPISIRHMKVGDFGVRNDTMTPGFGAHNHDVIGPDGRSLAQFPN